MANPLKFVQEVRDETSKVTWPTRNETLVTTIMVFILVLVASVFFFVADQILNWIVSFLLGLAG
jgi:preprotein translocase subunit SecE